MGFFSGVVGAPVRFKKFLLLPAALPVVGMPWRRQESKWFFGIDSVRCIMSGATIRVAVRPSEEREC